MTTVEAAAINWEDRGASQRGVKNGSAAVCELVVGMGA